MTHTTPDTRQVKSRPPVSVRLILTLVTAGLITLSVVGVGSVAQRHALGALRQEMEARLLLEARHLALLSADALLSDFPELTLVPLVREMQAEREDLAFAVVLDHNGLIQGFGDPRQVGQAWDGMSDLQSVPASIKLGRLEGLLANPTLMVAKVPVVHVSGRWVGTAVVGIHRSQFEAVGNATRLELGLLTAAILALGLLASTLVTRRILSPVQALRAGLQRIGQGDLNTPIELKDRTELGLLASTINRMSAQLLASRQATEAKEQEIILTQAEVINIMGEVVESRSNETANHTRRVGLFAGKLARIYGLDEAESQLIELAAPMHDLGKIGIPDAVLNKPGRYTPEEFAIMQRHADIGHQIFAGSKRELLQAAAIIAHQHHEKWDGSGYPRGLAGTDIHIYGRLVAIADVFDALSFDRVYRKAMSPQEVLDIIREGRGTHFDPHLIDLFLENIDAFQGLYAQNIVTPEVPQLINDLITWTETVNI